MAQGGFYHKYNHNDVFMRSVIVGLLGSLHEKLHITNQISDTETQDILIPFKMMAPSDERFMQDFYLPTSECSTIKSWGNIDHNPRGEVILTGVSINSDQLTNKFVRGQYNKIEETGEVKAYSGHINSIPLTFSFDITILFDTMIDGFKISEALWTTFYKVQQFNINYKGFMIPSQYGFPESFTLDKLLEYQFDTYQNDSPKISTSLEIETYYPIVDPTSEHFMGESMKQWVVNTDTAPRNSLKNKS